MGNCITCIKPNSSQNQNKTNKNTKNPKKQRPNPFSYSPAPVRVLNDGVSALSRISDKYVLGRELGRGEFGVTYLCTDRETKVGLACKSISKKKLRTAIDIEDVRREKKQHKWPNPFSYSPIAPVRVLKDSVSARSRISDKYVLGRELGRGEFGVTYLCMDRETKLGLACKSISKKKLRTAIDIEDVRREFLEKATKEIKPVFALAGTGLNDSVSAQQRSRISDKYVLGRELGRGEFGVTYLCTDRETKVGLVCKSISKKKLRTAIDIEDVRREVQIMACLPDHPNVVKLRATYEDNEAVHLVMELCEGGELFDRIVARGHYSERAAATVARTVAEVVRMCHENGVMHRDLKPENFLFANKKENSPLKAIDFGLSVFFKPGEKFSEIVGSPYYMAPEVLKRNYGPEVDIWSAGVILYILLCGVPPFWAETEQGVALAILRGVLDFKREPWPQISDNAKSLVKQMLEPDPRKRLTAQQVLEHPWIQNAKKASNVPLGDIVRTRLKQFSVMNRFKKKALRVIAEHLSVEEVEVIKEMFTLMDIDNDGKVTYDELRTGLRKVGSQLAEPEIKLLMDVADVDGNGVLDYGEFVAVTIHLQRMENDAHFRKAFTFFDKNESGFIELDELREALADESGETDADVLNEIMREVDTDKDGKISYDEFVAMMKTGTDWRKASRQYSRERFKSLSVNLMKDGSLQLQDGLTGQSLAI